MDVEHAFRLQAAACRRMGSPLYARLLDVATHDLEQGGAVRAVVDQWHSNAMEDAVPLRLLGGVHRLVLAGEAPDLARHFPSAGGTPEWPDCGEAFLDLIATNAAELRTEMLHPPQTNEVGRSGVLIGGLLEVVRLSGGLPIRLLEFGTSGGLNLLLDRYRYDFADAAWGDPDSPVLIHTSWRGSAPDRGVGIEIAARRGCDASPLDITDDGHARRLLSFVWADQSERVERTRAAIRLGRSTPVTIDAASADRWLTEQLATSSPGLVTVVMHSAVTQYLGKDLRRRIDQVVRRHARHATADAPLARLRLEPGQPHFALELDLWPRNIHLFLADAHPHGTWANWFIGATPR